MLDGRFEGWDAENLIRVDGVSLDGVGGCIQ